MAALCITTEPHSGQDDNSWQPHCLLNDHGFGVYSAYIPYVLVYNWHPTQHPDAPMNPYGGAYMHSWLADQLPFDCSDGGITYACHHRENVYEVGAQWGPLYGNTGDMDVFRGRMVAIMAALAAQPSIRVLEPQFDFATAPLRTQHTRCHITPAGAACWMAYQLPTGVVEIRHMECDTLQGVCDALRSAWDELEAQACRVLRVTLPV